MNERQSDFELLQAFVRKGDQAAFAQVVRGHLDLVYATAFQKLQESGAAQEVAQNAFSALARKAWQFGPDDSLPSWLYKTTLLASKEWLRGEMRRRRREQTAAELGTTMKTPDDQPALRVLVPMLDEALLSLREKERAALLLRFYENQSLREVGAALGVGEDAAQKRVSGALEKLTAFFQRRGYKTATVAASTAVLQHTAIAAPMAVANSVVLAAGQMAPPALLGLAAVAARFAGWSKVQTAAACLAVAAVPVVWQWCARDNVRAELAVIQTSLHEVETNSAAVQADLDRLGRKAAALDVSLAAAADSAKKQALATNQFETWKKRLRSRLLAADYSWPQDSPFVRIPKSVLPLLSAGRPIQQPGKLSQPTRELLGLTPQEREQIESALQTYFADVDGVIENRVYETNSAPHVWIPSGSVASQTWYLPALGEEVTAKSDALKTSLKGILGNERWPFVELQLGYSGPDTPRCILNLDADKDGQGFGLSLQSNDDHFIVSFSWSGYNSCSSSGGVNLDLFREGSSDGASVDPSEFLGIHDYPESIKGKMIQWIQQQVALHPAKEGVR